jgi:hypothetical protein
MPDLRVQNLARRPASPAWIYFLLFYLKPQHLLLKLQYIKFTHAFRNTEFRYLSDLIRIFSCTKFFYVLVFKPRNLLCTPVLRQIKYWIRNRLQVSMKKCEKLGRRKCGGNVRFICAKINSKPARCVNLLKTRHANANLFNYGLFPQMARVCIPSVKTGANVHVSNWIKLW